MKQQPPARPKLAAVIGVLLILAGIAPVFLRRFNPAPEIPIILLGLLILVGVWVDHRKSRRNGKP